MDFGVSGGQIFFTFNKDWIGELLPSAFSLYAKLI